MSHTGFSVLVPDGAARPLPISSLARRSYTTAILDPLLLLRSDRGIGGADADIGKRTVIRLAGLAPKNGIGGQGHRHEGHEASDAAQIATE